MQHIPCQKSDTVLWWTRQSLRRWRTKTNDVKNIQPFFLKPGDSIRDQLNYDGPNSKLKSLYNVEKSAWMLKYGTKKFTSPHELRLGWSMGFLQDVSCQHRQGQLCKKNLPPPPLRPPNLTTNTQACSASIQVYSGAKAGEINNISRHRSTPI